MRGSVLLSLSLSRIYVPPHSYLHTDGQIAIYRRKGDPIVNEYVCLDERERTFVSIPLLLDLLSLRD